MPSTESSSIAPSQITFEQLFKRTYGSAKIGVFGCGHWMYLGSVRRP